MKSGQMAGQQRNKGSDGNNRVITFLQLKLNSQYKMLKRRRLLVAPKSKKTQELPAFCTLHLETPQFKEYCLL